MLFTHHLSSVLPTIFRQTFHRQQKKHFTRMNSHLISEVAHTYTSLCTYNLPGPPVVGQKLHTHTRTYTHAQARTHTPLESRIGADLEILSPGLRKKHRRREGLESTFDDVKSQFSKGEFHKFGYNSNPGFNTEEEFCRILTKVCIKGSRELFYQELCFSPKEVDRNILKILSSWLKRILKLK